MALDSFTFSIALPPDADSLPLFQELSVHMARYLGLDNGAAAKAGEMLNQLVSERLDTGATVEVVFTRPFADAPVTVEISGPAHPEDDGIAARVGATVTRDGARSRLRLAWTVAGE